jgi:hypothetical protein
MARLSVWDGQQCLETPQEAKRRVSPGRLALCEETADGGLHHLSMRGNQQRQCCLVEDFREGSMQGMADELGADAGGTLVEVREQSSAPAVKPPAHCPFIPAYEPQSSKTAYQEVISGRG